MDNNSISYEAFCLAEDEFYSTKTNPFKVLENNTFVYKDDDGYWRISKSNELFDDYESLKLKYPQYA